MAKIAIPDPAGIGEPNEYDSWRECLEYEQVVKFVRQDDGTFWAVEQCDGWFFVSMTGEQVLEFAAELVAMVEEQADEG